MSINEDTFNPTARIAQLTRERDEAIENWYAASAGLLKVVGQRNDLTVQLETANERIAALESDITKINRLLQFAYGDNNVRYFGNDEETYRAIREQNEMRVVLDSYISMLNKSTPAAATADAEQALADKPLDELLTLDLSDPKVIEAIAIKPRQSNLQSALGR